MTSPNKPRHFWVDLTDNEVFTSKEQLEGYLEDFNLKDHKIIHCIELTPEVQRKLDLYEDLFQVAFNLYEKASSKLSDSQKQRYFKFLLKAKGEA